jgi:outer membrane cobalamin receptor
MSLARGAVVPLAACACAMLLAVPAAVRAQDPEPSPEEDVIPLPPIDVSAAPEDVPEAVLQNPSRFVEVIDAAPARERLETAATLVEDAAGVRVRRYGGLGSFATISIRGSSPTQVPVLVDGIPVGDARSGLVGLEELGTADLERIEVYRGFAPASVGEAGIGGAVNLVTRAAPQGGAPELSTGLSAGSFDTWRAWVSALGALGGGADGSPAPGLRLTFAALRTRGDYRFLSDHGTPADPSDDETLVRRNNDYLQATASARLAVPLDGWDLDAALAFVRTDQGLPGLDYFQAARARLEGTDARFRFTASAAALGDGLLALDLGAYASVRGDRFADPQGEIGVGRQVEDDLTLGGGAYGLATFFLGDGAHLLRVRLESGYESFRSAYSLPAPLDGPRQGRWLLRLGTGWEGSLLDDALVLLLDARADVHVDGFSGDPYVPSRPRPANDAWDVLFSPSAGLRWLAADGLELRANVGWFHRVPTFGELFGDRGSVVGNPGLRPESALNVDAGLAWRWSAAESPLALSLTAAFFGSFADELVVFVPQSQNVFRAENIGSSRTLGVESTLRAAWADLAALELRYTFEDARDTGDTPYWSGLRLPGRAPHDVAARLALSRWGLEAWYEADYLSSSPLDRSNLRTVPARLLHGAGLTYRRSLPGFDLSISLEGRNLGDAWAYDAFRYPLPGRSVFASFALRL